MADVLLAAAPQGPSMMKNASSALQGSTSTLTLRKMMTDNDLESFLVNSEREATASQRPSVQWAVWLAPLLTGETQAP